MSVNASNSIDSFGEVESGDSIGKDKTELELEKLVFGDEIGFHEGLEPHEQRAAPTSQPNESGGLQEEGLEEIDDADVCTLNWALCLQQTYLANTCLSSSSLTLGHRPWLFQT